MTTAIAILISIFTFVQLNCENLFDCLHDEGKEDTEFLPEGRMRWSHARYWRKLNRTGQTIISCADQQTMRLPDMAMLCEVENDTVMRDLTRRSMLRNAGYEYVMTDSPDARGIDVALVFSPMSFRLLKSHSIRIEPISGMRPTRDILYAAGQVISGDTLHVIGVHFPSRRDGELQTRPFRRQAAKRLCALVDSIREATAEAKIIIAGDFNMNANDDIIKDICCHGLNDISAEAVGEHGARGTYRYHGKWESLDHILVSDALLNNFASCHINDAPFLTINDEKYGGRQPRRNYLGPVYKNGFSDHLPLVATLRFDGE